MKSFFKEKVALDRKKPVNKKKTLFEVFANMPAKYLVLHGKLRGGR